MSNPKHEKPTDPRIGTILAERFRVDAPLGSGGMGTVYRAEHIHMRKTLAVKVLHREMTALDEVVKRFEREAIAAGRIEHPNVAGALDFGQLPDGAYYLVLEYVPGRSLRDTVAADGRFTPARALAIARQIALALGAAHAVGIVHRDLKPDNVMLIEKEGTTDFVKVLDFGIAKVTGTQRAGTQLTQLGTVFGTPQYMAPEQAAGQPVDHRADLYALGLIMHELLSGHPTFQSEELMVLLTMQLTAPPPPLPQDVPAPLAALVANLLDKSPSARPESAAAVIEQIDLLLRDTSGTASRSREVEAVESSIASRRAVLEAHVRSLAERLRPLAKRARTLGAQRIRGKVPVWSLVAGAALLGGATSLVWPAQPAPRHSGAKHQRTASTNGPGEPETVRERREDAPLDAEIENWVALASRGDHASIEQLARQAETLSSARVWLAIARGRLKLRDVEGSLDAFGRAIAIDPTTTDDSTMLDGLGYFGAKEESCHAVLDFAAKQMGPRGADLIFYVWSATSQKTPATRYAHTLLDERAVQGEMSDGLQLALAVRNAEDCDDYKALLPRLKEAGDERSYLPLRDLTRTSGCGPDRRQDCYQCLRDDSLLKDTLVQVQLRKAPHFDSRRWR